MAKKYKRAPPGASIVRIRIGGEWAMGMDRRFFLTAAGALATSMAGGWYPAAAENTARSTARPGSLTYRSVSVLRATLDALQVSALELLEYATARIEAHDSHINAVGGRDCDRARASATEAYAGMVLVHV